MTSTFSLLSPSVCWRSQVLLAELQPERQQGIQVRSQAGQLTNMQNGQGQGYLQRHFAQTACPT